MNSDTLALASLSLTHVFYDPSDPISYLCALLALVPQALCIIYVTLIYSSREIELILMFAGQMLCEALNLVLKRTIQEERPAQLQGRGYGMPSSHSQFVAFFSAYLTLFLLIRHLPEKRPDPNPSPDSSPATFLQRLIVSTLACAGAAVVIYSRVYLRYHTKKQVLVGAALGVGFAIVWFIFTKWLRSAGLLETVLDCELSQIARIRDLMTTEDFAEAGWVKWRQERERSRRQQTANAPSRKNL